MKSPIENTHLLEVAKGLIRVDNDEIEAVALALMNLNPFNAQKVHKVWTMGNGGSAATASHFANDLTKACGIPAICLNDMTPTLTAYSNDHGYEVALWNMLQSFLVDGDIVVQFSCSGNSPNVVNAFSREDYSADVARIVFTGDDESCAIANNDPEYIFHAKAPTIETQEDIHLILCHAIVMEIKKLKGYDLT